MCRILQLSFILEYLHALERLVTLVLDGNQVRQVRLRVRRYVLLERKHAPLHSFTAQLEALKTARELFKNAMKTVEVMREFHLHCTLHFTTHSLCN